MKASERHEKILQLVKEKGTVSIADLKEHIPDASEVTFRRDLLLLSEENKLIRTYGGAKSVDMMLHYQEDEFQKRLVQNAEDKRVIAMKAVELMSECDRLFLDSGSTCTFIAKSMPDRNYDVTTTGLSCAIELSKLAQPTVTMVGGTIYKDSCSVNGDICVAQLENNFFKLAFIGVMGYVPGHGFMTSVAGDHILKRKVVQQSQKVVVVMDHTKVGNWGTHLVASLPEIYAVISDGQLPQPVVDEFKRKNILVL